MMLKWALGVAVILIFESISGTIVSESHGIEGILNSYQINNIMFIYNHTAVLAMSICNEYIDDLLE